MTTEPCLPPPSAYEEVAGWLGEEWFLAPTPDVGVLLTIQGRDTVVTRWHVDSLTASRLADWAHDCPGLAVLGRCTYDHRASMP